MKKITLVGEKCIIAHLLDESQVRSFLKYCCAEANLEAEGDSKVKYHRKLTTPKASGFGGRQRLKDGGHIGVSTFPYLDRNGGFVEVSVALPKEVVGFQQITETGIQQFFGALNILAR